MGVWILGPHCRATISIVAESLVVEMIAEMIAELIAELVIESVVTECLVSVITAAEGERVGAAETVEFVEHRRRSGALTGRETEAEATGSGGVAAEGEHGPHRFPVADAEDHIGWYVMVVLRQRYHAG